MTNAAMAIVAMKVLMLRSKRVATRRQSSKRQNMRSSMLRCRSICRSCSICTLRLDFEGMTGVVPRLISHERKALLS